MTTASGFVGIWFHSYEEDTGEADVYRPKDFPFPPSRGRPGVEFCADGRLVEMAPGADDRGAVDEGRWRDLGAGQIEMSYPGTNRAPSERRILSCENGVLRLAK